MARSGHLNISGLWVSGYDVLFFWIRPICRRCPQLVLRSILWNIDREYLSEETLLRIAARNLVLSLLLRFFVFLMITSAFELNSREVLPSAVFFWTSRGRRCRPFSPPARAFIFCGAQGSAFPLHVDFHRRM